MLKPTRRKVLQAGVAIAILPGMVPLINGCQKSSTSTTQQTESNETSAPKTQMLNSTAAGELMKVQYLEIVTPEVDAMCLQYSTIYGISFSEPDANFGGARTAKNLSGKTSAIDSSVTGRSPQSPNFTPAPLKAKLHWANSLRQ